MKKLLSGILASSLLISSLTMATTASTFSDVPSTYWAHGYIQTAVEANLVEGTGNGKFSPEEIINYGSFAVIIVNGAFGGELSTKDSDSHWSDPYINVLLDNGLLESNHALVMAQNSGWQEAGISRENVATVVARLAETMDFASAPDLSLVSHFTDISHLSTSQQEDIAITVALDVMNGTSDTKFGSGETFNRASASVIIEKMLDLGLLTARKVESSDHASTDADSTGSSSYPESLDYYKNLYSDSINSTAGQSDVKSAKKIIGQFTTCCHVSPDWGEHWNVAWKNGEILVFDEGEDRALHDGFIAAIGTSLPMESAFAQENPLSLGLYVADGGQPYIFVDHSSNPLWAELLDVSYRAKTSTGTPVTPTPSVVLPTLTVWSRFTENSSLLETYESAQQNFQTATGVEIEDPASSRFSDDWSTWGYLMFASGDSDVMYSQTHALFKESDDYVSIEEIRTVYPDYASHVTNLPVSPYDDKHYVVPDGWWRTENSTRFEYGYYIARSAWEDPELRDAAVEFVQYMTSNEAFVRSS